MPRMLMIKKKIVSYLDSIANKIRSSIQADQENTNVPINTLAPKVLTQPDDIKRIEPYLTSLNQAIVTAGINNIAIAGSYGSGKSTILKTFQNQNQQYKYLNISLASFKDNKDAEDSLERKLEISILQQMFYHVIPSTIPDSRFKRIINITRKRLLVLTSVLIAWLLSTMILFKFSHIEKIDPHKWHIKDPLDWITLIASIIFFMGIALFIKTVYRLLSNSKINKLNIKGELELGEAVDKSVFNQHLEEILYFFERTEFNVVIIEDVDRFNSTDIFTKLREINTLINNSNLIHRQVKFIYAIKDEMFTDKNERVKFFEHIIPVIPFINPNNANEQLSQLIKQANLQNILSQDFTSDVVTFIDDIDMRLLTNIFQEYQIYKNILNPALNQDKLFAILVYKNMYPDDFGELSKRKGKLYRFLTGKKAYIDSIVKDLNLQIQSINKQILEIEQEVNKPIRELRAIYINKLLEKIDRFHCFYNGGDIPISAAAEDSFFKLLQEDTNIRYKRYEMQNYQIITRDTDSGIKFSTIEKEVSQKSTYQQREKSLINIANNKINSLKLDRINIKRRITELESMSIQEIFEEISIDSHIEEFNDSILMKSLLINGYIDEHYDDYISLFHGISLTNEDFLFERNAKSGTSLPFDYELTHIDTLIKKLPEKYFKKVTTLNFSILEYLLENANRFRDKLENTLHLLTENNEQQTKFMISFLKKKPSCLGDFIKRIAEKNKNIWQFVRTNEDFLEKDLEEFTQLLFEHTPKETISQLTNQDTLISFIEDHPSPIRYLTKFNPINTLKDFISAKGIKLKSLDEAIEGGDDNIFDYIYNNDHYEINADNIFRIIKRYNQNLDTGKLYSSHYTTIKNTNLPSLISYISDNVEVYISGVISLLTKNTEESEDTIIEILNREDLHISTKEKFVTDQISKIENLSLVNNHESKRLLLELNMITITWDNISIYYDSAQDNKPENDNTSAFDNTLIEFLNLTSNSISLSNQSFKSGSSRNEEYFKKMANVIIHCDPLSTDSYTYLIGSLPYHWPIFSSSVSDEKIERLLEKKKLSLSQENIDFLYKKKQALAIRLIELYQIEFVSKHKNLSIDANIWASLINDPNILLKNKLELIQNIDDSIIVNNSILADAVCSVLPADQKISLRYEVINAMFDAHSSVQRRISLLILYIETLDDDQLQNLIKKLGADYEKIFRKMHKPTFPNNNFNSELFKILKDRNLIIRSKMEDEGKSIKVFAKY